MTRKTTSELTIVTYRVVEEITDDDNDHPSLPPTPAATDVVTTTGETLSEQIRPLRAVRPSNVIHFQTRKAG
jgi:hypothetical protein